ncbi:MAG TPA: cytochrome-c peroxidase [Burkholderiales bacterium]|nr:cytochrome-c peroxidase [Burkholderiales bacterium]
MPEKNATLRNPSRFVFGILFPLFTFCQTLPALADTYAFPKVPVPADNPMTPEKIELGKQLYFDPRISLSGAVSCNSCHNVTSNGTDNLPLSFGVFGRVDVPRNSPTVFNAAFNTVQFWDGRAKSLEEQAQGPIQNHIEMGMPSGIAVVDRLEQIPGYREEFARVFGAKKPLTFNHVVEAIATYERTLITPDSPYDQYMAGNKKALDPSAIAGMKLVETTGCETCHAGPMFDNSGTPMGTGFYQKFPSQPDYDQCAKYIAQYKLKGDEGRFKVTHKATDKNMFKVPTWRNVALTAPYFNYGTVQTLPEAVKVMAACQLRKKLTDKEVTDIVAFLNSLTGKFPKQTLPELPQTPDTTILMGVPALTKAADKK